MRPDHAAVQDQVLHVRIIDEMLMHIFPDIVFAPASKALVDAVPRTIFLRQQAPLGATAGDPEQRFQEGATVSFLTSISAGMALQIGVDFAPFCSRNVMVDMSLL